MATVTLPDPGGVVTPLVEAAARVQHYEPASALVGGVAVICRLAEAHRATLDADTVVEAAGREHGQVIRVLRARPGFDEPQGDAADAVRFGDVTVEVITAERPSAEEIADVDDPKSRLFVAAHRWALDSASVTTVACGLGGRERRFDLRLATVPALVVTKTHALVGRRAGKEDKLGSDLLDLVLLLERFDHDATVSAELSAAPYGLVALARQLLSAFLADEQELTRAVGRAGRASDGRRVSVDRVHGAFRNLLEG